MKLRLRQVKKNVIIFMQSERSREFFIFLLFLLLSLVFWMLQSLNEDVEVTLKVPVEYTHIPDKMIITSEPPEFLEVRLRDKGTTLMGYMVDRIAPVEIDLGRNSSNKNMLYFTSADLLSMIRKQLKPTTSILTFSPDAIGIYYTFGQGVKLPVHLVYTITTTPQCIISGDIRLSHDSVMVYAPQNILKGIREIRTQAVAFKSLSDTLETTLSLQKIKGVKIVPDRIKVTVPVEEITTKIFKLPITTINMPNNISILTFPAEVEVSCMVAISRFAKVKMDDFIVGIDYNQLSASPGNKLRVNVFQKPEYVNNIQIIPDSVEYILEEKNPL